MHFYTCSTYYVAVPIQGQSDSDIAQGVIECINYTGGLPTDRMTDQASGITQNVFFSQILHG